jgi:hypothetical protein
MFAGEMVATGRPLQSTASLHAQIIQVSDGIMCGMSFGMRSRVPSPHKAQGYGNSVYRTFDCWLTSAKTIKMPSVRLAGPTTSKL